VELSTAVGLIQDGVDKSTNPKRWADLGAGDGKFTLALASLLPPQSSILAVDRDASALSLIPSSFNSVMIETLANDFSSMSFKGEFDGFMMANSLHYVREQVNFLRAAKSRLGASGSLLVVEYERTKSNPWVPYPLNFQKLREIARESGFPSVKKLAEMPSSFGAVTIYAAVVTT
jgi:ubiquinone/menaquinone biosynthesis C-methylase UbiE